MNLFYWYKKNNSIILLLLNITLKSLKDLDLIKAVEIVKYHLKNRGKYYNQSDSKTKSKRLFKSPFS